MNGALWGSPGYVFRMVSQLDLPTVWSSFVSEQKGQDHL
jgi:hypothetical protein